MPKDTQHEISRAAVCKQIAEKAVKDWFAYQNSVELELALRVIDERKPKVILEIGVAHGGSLAAWVKVANPDLAIGIDPLTLPHTPEQQASFDKLIKENNIKMIPWVSRLPEAHKELKKLLKGRKVDFLFIDGGHGYDDARHDFQEYKKYLNPNAMVGFHDIYYSDVLADAGSLVSLFWERIKRNYIYHDEFHYHSTMGIGIIQLGSYKWK